jgi:Leucine-rich repeat (LRR) protein
LHTLPSGLARLTSLVDLNIGGSKQLGDGHMRSVCESLPQLEELSVYATGITELPQNLTSLTRLETLSCQMCALRTIPDLSTCGMLRALSLDLNTHLTPAGIDPFFSSPPRKLTKVKLISCGFATLPQSLLRLAQNNSARELHCKLSSGGPTATATATANTHTCTYRHNFVVRLEGNPLPLTSAIEKEYNREDHLGIRVIPAHSGDIVSVVVGSPYRPSQAHAPKWMNLKPLPKRTSEN